MKIEALQIALRARNPWEAFDLGLALARHAGAPLFLAFGVPYALFGIAVNLALWGHPLVALTIVWWMKPLFDRLALAVLAQAVFGAPPGARATLKAWRAIPRTGLLWSLTLGRFDFARSFHLPIMQLEGQRGRAYRERVRLIDRRARGAAVWLAVVVVHFAYVIVLGLEGLVRLLAPAEVEFDSGIFALLGFGDAPQTLAMQVLFNAAFLTAECALEPLYVAAGFTYYLNRRSTLEGWDLEVAFKRLALRHAAPAPRRAGAGTAAVLALTLCAGASFAPGDARAATPPPRSAEQQAIEEILKRPAFEEHEMTREWRRRDAGPEPERRAKGDSAFWERLARFIAELLRVVAWIGGLALLGALVALVVRRLGWLRGLPARARRTAPDTLFGMDLRAISLPADIPRAAASRLIADDARGALSLLYRGALAVLTREREVEVPEGDTEADCARRVERSQTAATAAYFAALLAAWSECAYARRDPPAATVRGLIDAWAEHFAASGGAASGDAMTPPPTAGATAAA
jgi:hypothetical protein